MEMGREKNGNGYSLSPPPPSRMSKHMATRPSLFFMLQIGLRLLALVFTAVAIYMMLSSRQSISFFGIQFTAKYNYSAAFRFKVGTDATVCAFCPLSMILLYILSHRSEANPGNYFYLLLHDLVMAVLVVAGCAGATAIGYVGRYGQDESGWIPICDRVAKFCDKVLLSIIMSFLAFLCLLALSLMAAYKLKIHSSQ